MDVPRQINEVTVGFLSESLGRPVHSVHIEQIGVGVGMLGQLARLHLAYSEHDGPPTAILKLPTAALESRQVGDYFRLYEREGRFYEQVASSLPVRVPHCYWAHTDPASSKFALLLEDFAGRSHLDQLEGIDPHHARAAVNALALLHATWWESPHLGELTWLPRMSDPVSLAAGEQYRVSWPRFLDLFGDRLPPGAEEIGERVKADLEAFFLAADRGPQTLCHGDYRADNLLFDDQNTDESQRVGILDWQICNSGAGIGDIAYFCASPCQSRTAASTNQTWFTCGIAPSPDVLEKGTRSRTTHSQPLGATTDDPYWPRRCTPSSGAPSSTSTTNAHGPSRKR